MASDGTVESYSVGSLPSRVTAGRREEKGPDRQPALINSPPKPPRRTPISSQSQAAAVQSPLLEPDLFGFTTLKLHRQLGRDIVSKRAELS